MFHFILSLSLVAGAFGFDCTGLPDGIYGMGCRSYTICTNEQAEVVDCTPEVFNLHKEPEPGCDLPENTPPPCGVVMDCSELDDGSYPILDGDIPCEYFFTCLDGNDLGIQTCNPGTVFDFERQICDYPERVPPPCGSFDP